ncbi:MAG: hypothetical protein ACI9H6_000099 [Patiriisocius sp.]|jgi:hypothetical protein
MKRSATATLALLGLLSVSACATSSGTGPVAGISRDAFAAAPAAEQNTMANTMRTRIHGGDRFDQIALMAGQTVTAGSGRNQITMTCLKGVLSISVAQSANANVRAMSGAYITHADYHCNEVEGALMLAKIEGSDHIGKLITAGIFRTAGLVGQGAAAASIRSGGSAVPATVITNLVQGGESVAIADQQSITTSDSSSLIQSGM